MCSRKMIGTTAERRADRRIRQRLLEAAIPLLAKQGLAGGGGGDNGDDSVQHLLLREASAVAGCSLEQARRFFKRDEELVLALYLRLAAELEARVPELPEGETFAVRFRAAMLMKLALVAPYRDALGALLATLLDPRHELGALSAQTELVRSRVMGVFSAVVLGATDYPSSAGGGGDEAVPRLTRTLYGAHLALMLLWTQDRTPDSNATRSAIDLVSNLLGMAGQFLWLPNVGATLAEIDHVLAPLLEPPPEDAAQTETAKNILRTLFRYRRLQPGGGGGEGGAGAAASSSSSSCAESPCEQCLALHLPKVRRFVVNQEPVHFLLPAFPAKSPNPQKVLGVLPDMAEELALNFLEAVCREIKECYPPGARVTICSDGRVFSDLVGVAERDVTEYGRAIDSMIEGLVARSLDTLDLEDLYEFDDYASMREQLCAHYADSLETLEERAHTYAHHRALFNGIHRFLFEDQWAVMAATGKSRTSVRNECRGRAFRVIQRSEAWGRLIQECFPTALRLSIHPQHPHSDKIGILLGDAEDAWLTPWHAVALKEHGEFRLVRRHEAEALGARVVVVSQREGHASSSSSSSAAASHYEIGEA